MDSESGANGLAAWWSVGGYRVDEKSDFGMISPDGTPRPAALALARLARLVTASHSRPGPEASILVDRDLHAAAYQAVYENHKGEYLRALGQGKAAAVRTVATGTNSADCPLEGAGNTPPARNQPLKHLNAEFVRVEVRVGSGQWMDVEEKAQILVGADETVAVRAVLANSGEPAWLPGGPEVAGTVSIELSRPGEGVAAGMGEVVAAAPCPGQVERHKTASFPPMAFRLVAGRTEAELVLRLGVRRPLPGSPLAARLPFGESRTLRIRAANK
jgi:hypothetical protein